MELCWYTSTVHFPRNASFSGALLTEFLEATLNTSFDEVSAAPTCKQTFSRKVDKYRSLFDRTKFLVIQRTTLEALYNNREGFVQ